MHPTMLLTFILYIYIIIYFHTFLLWNINRNNVESSHSGYIGVFIPICNKTEWFLLINKTGLQQSNKPLFIQEWSQPTEGTDWHWTATTPQLTHAPIKTTGRRRRARKLQTRWVCPLNFWVLQPQASRWR